MTSESVSVMQAETRAEFAERSVAKLEKTIDDLEGMLFGVFCLLAFLPPNPECYYDYFCNVFVSLEVFWVSVSKNLLGPFFTFLFELYPASSSLFFRQHLISILVLLILSLLHLVGCFFQFQVGKGGFKVKQRYQA